MVQYLVQNDKIVYMDDSEHPFIEGWTLPSLKACTSESDCPGTSYCDMDFSICKEWGRPVDIEILPDGSIAVSDVGSGTIWRVYYVEPGIPWWTVTTITSLIVIGLLCGGYGIMRLIKKRDEYEPLK